VDSAAEKLVAGLRGRDPRAFDDAYARWRPRLHAFLARQCGDRSLAEDLLQETFVRLAERAANLRADTDLGAWLFTVARNLAASHGRWRRFTDVVLGALRLTPSTAPPGGPFEALAATESARRLEASLASLPARRCGNASPGPG
jgi:RNA polymerase sigma-70 factor (ECF subfamily)